MRLIGPSPRPLCSCLFPPLGDLCYSVPSRSLRASFIAFEARVLIAPAQTSREVHRPGLVTRRRPDAARRLSH